MKSNLRSTQFFLAYSLAIMFGLSLFMMAQSGRVDKVASETKSPQSVGPAGSHSAQSVPLLWTTLGTNGGPVVFPGRSEPANLLQVNGKPWLVDCGDGAVERLSEVGLHAPEVEVVIISHLHMDHIGGLQALLGLRWMSGARTTITVYGPPGIQKVVDGILQSLEPSVRIAAQEGMAAMTPEKMVKVVTLKGSGDLSVDGVRVRWVQNSHFEEQPGHAVQNGSQSLSYRFEVESNSVTYTGDTGPSTAVTQLAEGTDLLVSEVIDRDAMVAKLQHDPRLPEGAKAQMISHFNTQHLSPREAGQLGATAGAKRLVFTHLATDQPTYLVAPRLITEAHEKFKGIVVVARDLDQF